MQAPKCEKVKSCQAKVSARTFCLKEERCNKCNAELVSYSQHFTHKVIVSSNNRNNNNNNNNNNLRLLLPVCSISVKYSYQRHKPEAHRHENPKSRTFAKYIKCPPLKVSWLSSICTLPNLLGEGADDLYPPVYICFTLLWQWKGFSMKI
jgi:hypothetical protein